MNYEALIIFLTMMAGFPIVYLMGYSKGRIDQTKQNNYNIRKFKW